MQKRIAAIHDLSCFGKCSLSVVLPVISAMGLECVALPTALLPGHFAALKGVEATALTAQMEAAAALWVENGLTFDAVFSGYLAEPSQCAVVAQLTRQTCPQGLLVVDPAMADKGRLYHGYGPDHVAAMGRLCAMADVIVPNLTESYLLLGETPRLEGLDRAEAERLLRSLGKLGARQVVLTGVSLEPGLLGAALWDGVKMEICQAPAVPGQYNGAGDLFAAVLTTALTCGASLFEAARLATDFTAHTVAATASNPLHRPYGLDFELCLPWLMERWGQDSIGRSAKLDLCSRG